MEKLMEQYIQDHKTEFGLDIKMFMNENTISGMPIIKMEVRSNRIPYVVIIEPRREPLVEVEGIFGDPVEKQVMAIMAWTMETSMGVIPKFLQSSMGDLRRYLKISSRRHTSEARKGVPKEFRNKKKQEHRPFPKISNQ